MAWQTVPGLAGKVYTPECRSAHKKKCCPDCFTCQQCSDERCAVCGPAPVCGHPKRKSSLAASSFFSPRSQQCSL
ncbi:MAG: hypothetical protein WAU91_06635 [Desulfatitalea sp.]